MPRQGTAQLPLTTYPHGPTMLEEPNLQQQRVLPSCPPCPPPLLLPGWGHQFLCAACNASSCQPEPGSVTKQ